MELSIAKQIIKEQYDYLCTLPDFYHEDDSYDIAQECSGDNISEYVTPSDYAVNRIGADRSKLYVTKEDQAGGEGQGDYYAYVFKIDHPEHGIGYIQYSGTYDSWNGTDWSDGNETMVVPAERIIRVWNSI